MTSFSDVMTPATYFPSLQTPQKTDQGLLGRFLQLLRKRGHLAFDAIGDDCFDSLVGLGQPMQVGAFIARGVISMAMRTVHREEFRALDNSRCHHSRRHSFIRGQLSQSVLFRDWLALKRQIPAQPLTSGRRSALLGVRLLAQGEPISFSRASQQNFTAPEPGRTHQHCCQNSERQVNQEAGSRSLCPDDQPLNRQA
jgi:hypothetical protein